MAALKAKVQITVHVEGREPLTARPVILKGKLTDARFDGYFRNICMVEEGSNIEYWVAGSNSTRSIATRIIKFLLNEYDLGLLQGFAQAKGIYIPRISSADTRFDKTLRLIDTAPDNKNDPKVLQFLLDQLKNANEEINLESALSLRAFESLIVSDSSLQHSAENEIIIALKKVSNRDTRIALAEDLGYIGTDKSITILSNLLKDNNEDDHIRWASAIALGRLSGDTVVNGLLPGLLSDYTWTQAGTLLSLSRRACNENQELLEEKFLDFLTVKNNPLLKRYACLGLSKFEKLSDKSLEVLRNIIEDLKIQSDVKGYAALALSSNLQDTSKQHQEKLNYLLNSIKNDFKSKSNEPEYIWGTEFMAELATLLEQHSLSAEFHNLLVYEYKNWKSKYYESMKLYETAEGIINKGNGENATAYFQEALGKLPKAANLPEDAIETISFRRDIINARLQLHILIHSWNDVIDPKGLLDIENGLRDVGKIYDRYISDEHRDNKKKEFSKRELQYMKNTKMLVEVLILLVQLDKLTREGSISKSDIRNRVDLIIEAIEPLHDKFKKNLAKSLHEIVENTIKKMEIIMEVILEKKMEADDIWSKIRLLITEIQDGFCKSTWPMPARACPASGLGKGTIRIIQEEIPGKGSEHSPYIFPVGTRPIINVVVEIIEMAPGGFTKPQLVYKIGCDEDFIQIPINEGLYRTTIKLPNLFSKLTSTKCEFSLRFKARDCIQTATELIVYIKWGRL